MYLDFKDVLLTNAVSCWEYVHTSKDEYWEGDTTDWGLVTASFL